MKAAWYERNGPARDVLTVGEIDTPVPGPGEVRVKIAVSGVNPSDVKSRRGRPLVGRVVVPHSDGAGVIDAIGHNANHARMGERVWLWNGQWRRPHGTAAEYICLPDAQAVHLPPRVDFASGACLGIPAMTALHAVRLLGSVAGKTVLVTGAGSSVGHYATQIAKHLGARVIGTASAAKSEHARHAGADFVIDYKTREVAKTIRELTKGKGVDAVVDMDLSSTVALIADAVVAPHGTIACYGSNIAGDIALPFPVMLWNSYALKVFVVYELKADERRIAITELNKLLEANVLKHAIGPRFDLRDIAAAHEAVEGGKAIGNVVIDIG